MMWIQAWEITHTTMSDETLRREGQHNPNIRCPYGVYETKDGDAFMLVVAMSDESWDEFWLFVDRPEVVLDARWNNVAKRIGARGGDGRRRRDPPGRAGGVRQPHDRGVDRVPGHPARDHLRADPELRRAARRPAGRGERLPRRRSTCRRSVPPASSPTSSTSATRPAAACAGRRRCSASTPPRSWPSSGSAATRSTSVRRLRCRGRRPHPRRHLRRLTSLLGLTRRGVMRPHPTRP